MSSSLPIPPFERNFLISPPPSPPDEWETKMEGEISKTLPFHDLPDPQKIELSASPRVVFAAEKSSGQQVSQGNLKLIFDPLEMSPSSSDDLPFIILLEDETGETIPQPSHHTE